MTTRPPNLPTDDDSLLAIDMDPQPSDTTCGPTALAAVYRYWHHPVGLDRLIGNIGQLDGGGTLAVTLACDALRRGFDALIITYNLQLFDPTWFNVDGNLCALSATYLYQEARERTIQRDQGCVTKRDDIGGDPQGHFVVLRGYASIGEIVYVAEPLRPNPMATTGQYTATLSRVAAAVLLSIVTYDANLLIIRPREAS